jgi:hypothetical protein
MVCSSFSEERYVKIYAGPVWQVTEMMRMQMKIASGSEDGRQTRSVITSNALHLTRATPHFGLSSSMFRASKHINEKRLQQ